MAFRTALYFSMSTSPSESSLPDPDDSSSSSSSFFPTATPPSPLTPFTAVEGRASFSPPPAPAKAPFPTSFAPSSTRCPSAPTSHVYRRVPTPYWTPRRLTRHPSRSSSPSPFFTHTTGITISSAAPVHLKRASSVFTTIIPIPPPPTTRRAFSTKFTLPRPTTTTFPFTSHSSSPSAKKGTQRTASPLTSSSPPNTPRSKAISSSASITSPPPPLPTPPPPAC
mmetsp:Transcript_25639/g.61806  ORF Transcript_25639/g.61806 Transcript_25639/m.61806 type:complete len:224 (-) Transcript_25639:41-712(-)